MCATATATAPAGLVHLFSWDHHQSSLLQCCLSFINLVFSLQALPVPRSLRQFLRNKSQRIALENDNGVLVRSFGDSSSEEELEWVIVGEPIRATEALARLASQSVVVR